MVLALRSFLRIAAGDKLLFWDTSQAGENLANHLVDDLIQNVHSVAGLPGAIRLLAEFSVAGVANAERIVQSTIGELTPFPAGRQGEPCTTVAAVNVIGKQCLSTGTKRNMVFGFFRCVGRAIFPDTLCSFKLLLRDDLEFGHQFGAGISAAENAHVGQVADHSSQAARMPALSRAGTVSSIVQIGGNPLCAVTLVYIFIEDQPNDFGFLLVDISIDFEVNDLSNLPFDASDMVVLLSNLLDNAIEACQRYDKGDKAIHVMAVVQQDFFISVRNTSEPVVIINGSIPTTKPEPQLHGFGLANIRLILEKYSGEYTMFYENGWFQFTADIPLTPIS